LLELILLKRLTNYWKLGIPPFNQLVETLVKISITLFVFMSIFSTAGLAATAPAGVCRYLQSNDVRWTPPSAAEWSYTNTGERSGLVNIYVHANLADLKKALHVAGYVLAKPESAANNAEYVAAAARMIATDGHVSAKTRYTIASMPVSPETVCGFVQVASFEKDNQILGGRHHLRIFNINRVDDNGVAVWAISALRDSKITMNITQVKTLFFYHAVDPNVDQERDMVVADLNNSGLIANQYTIPLSVPDKTPHDGVASNDRLAIEVILNSTNIPNTPPHVRTSRRNSDIVSARTL
jgi:hypothetical protein